jgi:hypothetical protein
LLQIRPVRTRADLSAFIKLPRILYRGMPGYAPPLDFERRELLDPKKAPFFQHAEAQYWIAHDGERAVGRISAQVDRLAVETWGENIGCFGCLDAIDDSAVVQALCDTAAAWLRERRMVRMRGPLTLSINGESGVLVDGQQGSPMLLMPWHPPYLAGHIAAAGFAPAKDLLTYTVRLKDYRRSDDLMARVQERLPGTLTLRPFRMKEVKQELEIVRGLYNEAWQNNWGFVPFTEAELAAFATSFKPFMIADCGVIAELDGKPIGFAVVLPNLMEVTKGFDGRLLPFNWIKFALKAFRINAYTSVRLLLFGIVPQLHRIGAPLALAIIDELVGKRRRFRGFEEVELGWVLEDNRPLITMMAALGVTAPSKRYRVFEAPL